MGYFLGMFGRWTGVLMTPILAVILLGFLVQSSFSFVAHSSDDDMITTRLVRAWLLAGVHRKCKRLWAMISVTLRLAF